MRVRRSTVWAEGRRCRVPVVAFYVVVFCYVVVSDIFIFIFFRFFCSLQLFLSQWIPQMHRVSKRERIKNGTSLSIVLVGNKLDSWDKEELPESSVSVVALIPPIEIIQNLHLLAADARVIVRVLPPYLVMR